MLSTSVPIGVDGVSGTEFELVTAVESKKARGARDIFIFKNDTKFTFEADEKGEGAKAELELAQWKALMAFMKEWCEREQDGQRVFTAALNRYQALEPNTKKTENSASVFAGGSTLSFRAGARNCSRNLRKRHS